MDSVSRNLPSPVELETNLGIATEYRVRLPTKGNSLLLFGNPEDHLAERGPLYLAKALVSDCSAFMDVGAHRGYFTFFLVKVDIENAEPEFLQGAGADSDRIRYLIMEVLRPAVQQGFLVEAMRKLDMKAYYINDFSLEYSADGSFTYVHPQYNWLFCRLTPEALTKRLEGTRFRVKDPSRLKSTHPKDS